MMGTLIDAGTILDVGTTCIRDAGAVIDTGILSMIMRIIICLGIWATTCTTVYH